MKDSEPQELVVSSTNAYFVPSVPTFIPQAWKEDGTYSSDAWPVDAVLLEESVTAQFWKQTPPDGKQLGSTNGTPAWVDLPPVSVEQLRASALARRDTLLATAALRIAPLQDAADLGDATDADTANLKLWKQYRVAVNRVPDQATFPRTISWPTPPAE